jgi:hypothetical protein
LSSTGRPSSVNTTFAVLSMSSFALPMTCAGSVTIAILDPLEVLQNR